MLYINNIDDYSFNMHGGTVEAPKSIKVINKKGVIARAMEPQSAEVQGRVSIWDTDAGICYLGHKPVLDVTLDGTVHTTAQAFVAAFNGIMGESEGLGGVLDEILS